MRQNNKIHKQKTATIITMDTASLIKNSIPRTKKFLHKSLSLWAEQGYDNEHGGYFEALDFNANTLPLLDKRFRIHPRSMFAHSAGTLWGYYNGIATAEKVFDYIINTCWLANGGFATLSDHKGQIKDTSIKTYDHAFVMLGIGWLYKASNKAVHREWLLKVWNEVLESKLHHADGGLITVIPKDNNPVRMQNPHMHMLEAMLNLVELFDEDIWRDAAKRLYTLFANNFLSASQDMVFEFFNDDWSLDKTMGHSLEPGHHYEWTWILEKYESLMKEPVPMLDAVYQFAIKGSNAAGFGYDECNADAEPIRDTHRMWVQTEVIKAHIAMYRHTANLEYLPLIYKAWEQLFTYYLIEDKGIWYDQLNDALENISGNAPTSTLYHVIIALHEYLTVAEKL